MKYKAKTYISLIMFLVLLFPIVALACTASLPVGATITEEERPASVVVVETVEPPEDIVSLVPEITTDIEPEIITNEEALLIELYRKVNPSVVNITVLVEQDGQLFPRGQGSGFVYHEDGYIITNAHVVQGADFIDVTFPDATVREADIVGEDLSSDLAVIDIGSLPEGVKPLPLGTIDSLAVGQTVIAIGNPFGLEGTLTKGIISALGRTIPALNVFSIPQSIQTDAAINPGNSGGPLLNLEGEVIGVNAQIQTSDNSRSNSGVGFAIPVSIVRLVIPDLIEKGEHDWAWLGVRGGNVFPSLVEAMDLPFEKGAYLFSIEESGPADNSGLEGADELESVDGRQVSIGGDVVTAIDGQPINSFDDLLIYIALKTEPDQEVTLDVFRDGEFISVKLKLESRPDSLTTELIPQFQVP